PQPLVPRRRVASPRRAGPLRRSVPRLRFVAIARGDARRRRGARRDRDRDLRAHHARARSRRARRLGRDRRSPSARSRLLPRAASLPGPRAPGLQACPGAALPVAVLIVWLAAYTDRHRGVEHTDGTRTRAPAGTAR